MVLLRPWRAKEVRHLAKADVFFCCGLHRRLDHLHSRLERRWRYGFPRATGMAKASDCWAPFLGQSCRSDCKTVHSERNHGNALFNLKISRSVLVCTLVPTPIRNPQSKSTLIKQIQHIIGNWHCYSFYEHISFRGIPGMIMRPFSFPKPEHVLIGK